MMAGGGQSGIDAVINAGLLGDVDALTGMPKKANSSAFNIENYIQKYSTENVEKLNKTMFMVDNFDKIIRAAASQFKSDGKDSVLKDIKNPNYSADTEVDSSGVGSLQEQMYAAWKKDN